MRRAGAVAWLLCVLACLGLAAHAQDMPYPGTVVDGCGGGAPGDPPLFTFAPGSATPQVDPFMANRVRIWRERIRPDIRLVLLRGIADVTEPGYVPGLALHRAQAVRDLLASMRIDPSGIWVRGDDATPASSAEHEPPFVRVVTVGDPLRAVDCSRDQFQMRFRWFTSHCVGQRADDEAGKACNVAALNLAGDAR